MARPLSLGAERPGSRDAAASYPNSARRSGRKPGIRRALLPLLGLVLVTLSACKTSPVTGRNSFNLFSAQDDVALGRDAYTEVLANAKVVSRGAQKDMVERVMSRITAIADDPGFEWEVTLIDDDATVNAFALPGGKMAVYTGILPVCQDEAGLAVVMGHEIGHVVAQHGTERMTRSLGIDVAFSLLNTGDYEALARSAVQLALELPYDRGHESEADEIGLIYMAKAGYDPRAAPLFWERMGALAGGRPPEWLSTHPSPETRTRRLEEAMPKALEAWRRAAGEAP